MEKNVIFYIFYPESEKRFNATNIVLLAYTNANILILFRPVNAIV